MENYILRVQLVYRELYNYSGYTSIKRTIYSWYTNILRTILTQGTLVHCKQIDTSGENYIYAIVNYILYIYICIFRSGMRIKQKRVKKGRKRVL